MEVVIVGATSEIGCRVADAIERLLKSSPTPVLGLATGSSPLPVYQELIARCRHGSITFGHAKAFLLDEYIGLDEGSPQSYRAFIERELTEHIDLPPDALDGPTVDASGDATAAGLDYERRIQAAGGIDLQLLGIGSDGHIGFNEPSSSLASRTRVKTLMEATRHDNARFFTGDVSAVPRHVITQGIGTILDARHVILIATGAGKAHAVAKAVEGPLTAMVPASALQLHPHATVMLDEQAASMLTLGHYYREAFMYKPQWQGL